MSETREIVTSETKEPFLLPDESAFCPICDSYNGHSLSCATLNVNGKTIEAHPLTPKDTET